MKDHCTKTVKVVFVVVNLVRTELLLLRSWRKPNGLFYWQVWAGLSRAGYCFSVLFFCYLIFALFYMV